MCIDSKKTYTATLETDAGYIEIALDAKKAPKTVNNFVVLSRYHFYDGLTFHRVITNFMAQGGDPEGNGTGGPGYSFEDELPKKGDYEIGSVAMANSGPDTNGSQFFIVTGQAGVSLPPDYSLFGKVTDGQDVLQRIAEDGSNGEGAPKVEHTIEKVTKAAATWRRIVSVRCVTMTDSLSTTVNPSASASGRPPSAIQ